MALLKAVNAETENKAIRYVAACPFWVSTPMTMTTKETLTFISPKTFVRKLMDASWARTAVNPHWAHKLVQCAIGLTPEGLGGKRQLASMWGTRKAIERKLAKQKKE